MSSVRVPAWHRDAEDAQLQSERGVVADECRQLEKSLVTEAVPAGLVLLVGEVGPGRQGVCQERDQSLRGVAEFGEPAVTDRGELGVRQAGRAGDALVRVDLEVAAPGVTHGEDGQFTGTVAEPGRVAHPGAEGL